MKPICEIPGILKKILIKKKQELSRDIQRIPPGEMQSMSAKTTGQRALSDILSKPGPQGMNIIAEIKRASPSRGAINMNLDPAKTAEAYYDGGACSISVLTEVDHFLGDPRFIRQVKDTVPLPVLRKDFIFDPYQLYQSRYLGADGVLLITAILKEETLRELITLCHSLEMNPLVEVHNKDEMEIAGRCGARLVGINNRNLADFQVNLETTLNLALVKENQMILVSESGFHCRADLLKVKNAGVYNFLIGENLASSRDPADRLKQLLGRS